MDQASLAGAQYPSYQPVDFDGSAEAFEAWLSEMMVVGAPQDVVLAGRPALAWDASVDSALNGYPCELLAVGPVFCVALLTSDFGQWVLADQPANRVYYLPEVRLLMTVEALGGMTVDEFETTVAPLLDAMTILPTNK